MKILKLFPMLLLFLWVQHNSAQNNSRFEKVEEMAYAIDSTLYAQDGSYTNKVYDMQALAKRFLIEKDNEKVKTFNKGFIRGFSTKFKFGNVMLEHIKAGASYDFMRVEKVSANQFYIFFRLYNEGINYHKHLVVFKEGKPKIIDTYVYITGEYLSDTFRSIYNSALGSQSFLKKLLFKDNTLKDLEQLTVMKKLKDKGDFKGVEAAYQKLSKNARGKKITKILRLLAAQKLSEKLYGEVIKDYETSFPNDPSLYLVSLDGLIMAQKYDKAIAAINTLDKLIGGDEFLNLVRGNLYYMKSDKEKAIGLFEQFVEDYPNFFDAYDSLLTLYTEEKKYTKAIEILDIFVNKFESPKEALIKVVKENFDAFAKTKEFLKWSK